MADPNTRTGKRTPVTLKIKFKSETLEQFIERYAVDVSQGGIFIRTKEPLPVGTQMKFEFQLRDASPLIGGEGTVVWTRENDPSRPAIAPGMGVRFDRLAEGSQSVLERILSEKAKQAPQRGNAEPTKPPLFTDQPTRVASLPMQEQLLGLEMKSRRRAEDSYNDQHTPLPKPMPFHSDADEFPDEAFEEATKVRPLDELIAQTAESNTAAAAEGGSSADELLGMIGATGLGGDARRSAAGSPSAAPAAAPVSGRPAFNDLESAPGLPSPPEAGPPPKPGRLLDTSPSPRIESPPPTPPPIEQIGAKTKLGLGLEAPRMQSPSAVGVPNPGATLPGPAPAPGTGLGQAGPGPTMGGPMSIPPGGGASIKDLPTRPSGIRAVAAEPTAPVRMTAPRKGAGAAIAILILVVLAAGAAGVWFFFLREKAAENAVTTSGSGSDKLAAGSGSDKLAAGSGSNQVEAGSGSNKVEVVKGPMVDTVVDSLIPRSSVEIVGTDQRGDAPFTAKLEKDKPYKARVMAVGYATLELDLVGGGPKQTASLVPKPRMLSLKTEPTGALISIDNVYSGKITPLEVELTKAQVAKKSVRIRLVKTGFKTIEKVVQLDAFTEDTDRMLATVDEKLVVQQVPVRPPPDRGSGTPAGSGSSAGSNVTVPPDGSGTPAGSGTPPAGSAAPPPPPPPPPAGGGGSGEPEPDFSKTP